MRQKRFQLAPSSQQNIPYDTQEFDDLLLRYVELVRRQFVSTQPVLAAGKIVGFTPLVLIP